MSEPIVYGPAYSTYARTARLALEEKGQKYKLVEIDALKGEAQTPEHLKRQPFGKVPAYEHDGFQLYETDAIVRYIDDTLPGPKLTPADPKQRARMNQIMGVIDNHVYGPAIGVVMQRLVAPLLGNKPDEAAIKDKAPAAEKAFAAIDRLIGSNAFLAGPALSLADLHLAPIMAYYAATPEGEALLQKAPGLARWWSKMKDRPSVARTAPKF